MNREILKIALPAIATNITVPLLSLVDMAIAGHLGNEIFICAISVGGTLLNLLYWNFGFLRMGTSGLTAQAFGAKDNSEMANILVRSIVVSLIACVLIILLKNVVESAAFRYMQTTEEVEKAAKIYISICIFGVPATMCLYSIKGWFIGMQNSVYPMIVALTTNIVNILCSLILVFYFDLGIKGIALGTVIAEYSGVTLAFLLWIKKYKNLAKYVNIHLALESSKLKHFCTLNGGIAIRTLCLTSVTCFFTLAGAKQGTTLLAVNTLLMQLFTLFSYFTDGFAYAGEALTGRYIGAKEKELMHSSIKYIFRWGFSLAFLFTILYTFCTTPFLKILTNEISVIKAAKAYHWWVIAIPFCGFAAFLWDGIMIGATMAKGMVVCMVCATASFFIIYNLLIDTMGNHGLWLAFIVYILMRGVAQSFYFKSAIKKII